MILFCILIPYLFWLFDNKIFDNLKINYAGNDDALFLLVPGILGAIWGCTYLDYPHTYEHTYLFYFTYCLILNTCYLTIILIINLLESKYKFIDKINNHHKILYIIITLALFIIPSSQISTNICKEIDKIWHIEEIIYDEDEEGRYPYDDGIPIRYQ